MEKNGVVPMLIPYEPGEFWERIRQIIHEEVVQTQKTKMPGVNIMETPGLTQILCIRSQRFVSYLMYQELPCMIG